MKNRKVTQMYIWFLLLVYLCFSVGCMTVNPKDLKKYPIEEKQFIIESSKSQKVLYTDVRNVIVDILVNKQAVDYEDKDSGVISITTEKLFQLNPPYGARAKLAYWIKIEVKEKKMRVTVNNFEGYWWYPENGGSWVIPSNLLQPGAPNAIDAYRQDYYNAAQDAIKDITSRLTKAASDTNDSNW